MAAGADVQCMAYQRVLDIGRLRARAEVQVAGQADPSRPLGRAGTAVRVRLGPKPGTTAARERTSFTLGRAVPTQNDRGLSKPHEAQALEAEAAVWAEVQVNQERSPEAVQGYPSGALSYLSIHPPSIHHSSTI